MKKDNDLLAEMPVSTAFFKLAIPAIAAQLINILYNLVDSVCSTIYIEKTSFVLSPFLHLENPIAKIA